jgi:Tol biopolymer transport system component
MARLRRLLPGAIVLTLAACTSLPYRPQPTPTPPAVTTSDRLIVLRTDGNLVSMAPDGTDVVPLTTDAGPDVVIDQPVASPDGRFLAWVEIRSGQPSLVTAARSGQRLQSVPMGIVPFFLQWDPTSTNIAYLGNAQTGIGMGVVENAATAPDDVAVGGGSPFYLSWSPDGRRLFVHVGTDQLGFTDLQHGLQKVHDRPGTFQAPVWLPDGRTVYDRLDGTQQQLVVVDGDHQRSLADITGSVAFVASPDGRRIAYRVDGGTASQDGVYVRPIDGGRPTLVTRTGAPAFFWSPAGDDLLLLTIAGSGSDRVARWRVWSGSEVLVTDPYRPSQTFGQRYLPFFDQYAQAFTPWAPDGSAFAFAGQIDGQSGIYVQRVGGGAPTLVSDGEFVLWSPPERATSTN